MFADCGNLERLLMPMSGISAIPRGTFSGLTKVQTIDLNGNRITELPLGRVAKAGRKPTSARG